MSKYTLNPIVQALTYEERISVVEQAVLMFTEEYIIVSMSQEDWLFDLKDILDKLVKVKINGKVYEFDGE